MEPVEQSIHLYARGVLFQPSGGSCEAASPQASGLSFGDKGSQRQWRRVQAERRFAPDGLVSLWVKIDKAIPSGQKVRSVCGRC